MIHLRRPSFTLLEVIIAFFLVTLCAVPLIVPSVWIIKGEKEFSLEIEADRISNLLLTKFLEHLYVNSFNWDELNEKTLRPLPEAFWEGIHRPAGWPYQVAYSFEEKDGKKGAYDGNSFHLFILGLSLIPNNPTEKVLHFDYEIFVERKTKKRSITPSEITPIVQQNDGDREEDDEEEEE
jgi:hypothetical protein